MNLQIKEALWIPRKINKMRLILKDRIKKTVKSPKRGEKFESQKIKWVITYKGFSIRQPANASAETLQLRRKWDDIFKMLKLKKKGVHWEFYI